MEKSPEAFRTISEVAEWLDLPTHVLRFWESRFAQVKPVKRAGGRRYYRPNDMLLIGGIQKLLHEDGMTIRAVQKLLREKGVKHVASLSKPLDFEEETANVVEAVAVAAPVAEPVAPVPEPSPEPEAPSAVAPEPDAKPKVVQFGSVRRGEPELPFIGTAADHEAAPASQPDEAEPEPAAPAARTIPPTPDVPVMDAEDESESHKAPAGIAARLIAAPGGLARNKARIAEAVSALHALRGDS